jgi:hypothetical protein
MSRVICVLVEDNEEINKLVRKKIVAAVKCGGQDLIVARYGVNKTTLRRISKKLMDSGK